MGRATDRFNERHGSRDDIVTTASDPVRFGDRERHVSETTGPEVGRAFVIESRNIVLDVGVGDCRIDEIFPGRS